ncbi:MAG: carboxypeptidase-like regulatory domain-containing protein [Bacteroidota bacterium]
MKRLLIILLVFSVAIVNAATIKGKLLDENKEPLTGANVILDASKNLYALAGLRWIVRHQERSTGTYTLKVSFIGYQSQEKTISITNDGDAHILDFNMAVDAAILGEVVVSARAEGGFGRRGAFGRKEFSASSQRYVGEDDLTLT